MVDVHESEETCLVLLTDFGYTVKIDLSQLVELPQFLKDIPNEVSSQMCCS